jgi:tRNA(Ile)-lysidine synthase
VRAFISAERPATFPDGRAACVMDAERLAFPLRVRPVVPGDRFQPLGMTGVKKVGDLFTDRKVPVRDRGKVAVMTDANDQIVWLVGHQIAEPARLRDDTRSCLYLQVEER